MPHLIREATEADWPEVAALEAAAYAGTPLTEGEAALRSRAAAGTCLVLERGGRLAGYVIALPFPRFHCPDLALPRAPSAGHTVPAGAPARTGPPARRAVPRPANLHLHDLVVEAPSRRCGLGTRLAGRLADLALARGFETVSLVAVDGREPFWRANGYRPHPEARVPAGYGSGAVYMSVRLAAPREASR